MEKQSSPGRDVLQPASERPLAHKDPFAMDAISEVVNGSIIGAAAGAAIGSLIFPGLGTAVGGGVGAAANALLKDYLKKRADRTASLPEEDQKAPTR